MAIGNGIGNEIPTVNLGSGGGADPELEKFIMKVEVTPSDQTLALNFKSTITSGGFSSPAPCRIEWGDGSEELTAGNTSHNYGAIGTYVVKISPPETDAAYSDHDLEMDIPPPIEGSTLGLNVVSIKQWGRLKWTKLYRCFKDHQKLVGEYSDIPDLSNIKNFGGSLIIGGLEGMFWGANAFQGPVNNWDMSNIAFLDNFFANCNDFNRPIDNWSLRNCKSLRNTLRNCRDFNRTIENWDVGTVGDMRRFFQNGNLNSSDTDTSRYDNTLKNWSQLDLQFNVTCDMGDTQYSAEGAIYRESIINNYSWTITDGGLYTP